MKICRNDEKRPPDRASHSTFHNEGGISIVLRTISSTGINYIS